MRFVPARDARGTGLSAIGLRVVDRVRLLARTTTRGARSPDDQVLICDRFNLLN